MRHTLLLALALWGAPSWANDPEVDRLLNRTDDITRGESSTGTMSMQVKTDRYERTVRMEVWTKGTEKSLVRIIEPAKEMGTATLKVEDNIWNYLPKVDRTIKVPSSMMGGSWMGSHFTNDDLVKENRLADEFTAVLSARADSSPDQLWVIELTPKPEAAVVWGKVIVRITKDELPNDIRYYDEKGALVRTMAFSEPKAFGTVTAPSVMRVVPADAPNEFTQIVYENLVIGANVPDEMFSLQSLKK